MKIIAAVGSALLLIISANAGASENPERRGLGTLPLPEVRAVSGKIQKLEMFSAFSTPHGRPSKVVVYHGFGYRKRIHFLGSHGGDCKVRDQVNDKGATV